MSECQGKPTILIVPGSFTTEALYTTLIEKLTGHGYETIFIRLPTTIHRSGPAPTMFEDAAYIHSICEKLANDGRDIVVTMHSYGGIPGSEAARGLGKVDRQAVGKPGGIVSLVYYTATIASTGQSLHKTMGDQTATGSVAVSGEWMSIEADFNARHTFSDLPYDEGLAWTAKMSQHSARSFNDELSYEAYRHIRVVYLLCTQDLVITAHLQQKMIDTAKSAESEIEVITCDAGHCPMVSQPESVVHAIRVGAGEHILTQDQKTPHTTAARIQTVEA